MSYSFIDQASAALFGGGDDAVRLDNPISSEMSHMRPDLLPGLLQAAARNQARGAMDLALFEIGPVFFGGEPGEQAIHATGLRVGAVAPRDPHGSHRPADLYDAKADAEAVLAALGAPQKIQVSRDVPGWFHPGRAGRIGLGPKLGLGVFGELHPRVVRALDIKGSVVAFSVWLENLPHPRQRQRARPALLASDLQAVERDFAFVVDARTEAAALVAAAAGADKALIDEVRLFDEFTGPKAEAQMGEGRKSLAITVRLQPRSHTLTDTEIEAVGQRVVEKVQSATGGILRR